MIIILIVCVILLIIGLVLLIKHWLFVRSLLNGFKNGNSITFGKKGRGKDLLFQWVINKRKDFYYSNLNYGGKHKIVAIKDISIFPNTYQKFILNDIDRVKRNFFEEKDFYISDIGNYLPSQYDSMLHKTFPSMPLFYSLSRHLYNSNIHCNSQSLERPWKALREQADFFVKCKGVIKLPFFLIISVNTYDKYKSALDELEPLSARILNKYSKAETDLYIAQHGEIKHGHIFVRRSKIKYDTRAFENLIFEKGSRRRYKRA